MKKFLFVILFFSFTFNVEALIKQYDVEITLLDDGRLFVMEAISMDDPYYGFEKNITYQNTFTDYYYDLVNLGHDYNFDVVIDSVKAINYDGATELDTLYLNGDEFSEVSNAFKGDYGVYTLDDLDNNVKLKIYNDSSLNKDLLISYYIDDLVIKHADSYELLFNLFNDLKEDIANMTIKVNIPSLNTLVYLHKIDGEVIDNEDFIEINLNNITKNKLADFRILFNSDVLVRDKTDIYVLDKINDIETDIKDNINMGDNSYQLIRQDVYNYVSKALESYDRTDYENALTNLELLRDEDNLKLELELVLLELESQISKYESYLSVFLFLPVILLVLLVIVFNYKTFSKQDETKNTKVKKYYTVEELSYLKNKNVNQKMLISSFLSLVDKQIITVKTTGKGTIYQLDLSKNLDSKDGRLVKIFFSKKSKISYEQFLTDIKTNYRSYIINYSNWLNLTVRDMESKEFYLDLFKYKTINFIIVFLGFLIYYFLKDVDLLYNPLIVLILTIGYLVFNILFYKRTNYGKRVYNESKNSDTIKQVSLSKKNLTHEQILIKNQLSEILKHIHHTNRIN